MRLIVGLGNPGEQYLRTRHNIGWRVIDAFADRFRIVLDRHEKLARVGEGRVAGSQVMLAKPETFMNLSGEAVSKLVRAYVEDVQDLIVVYDDVDLPLGRLRLRERGSAGTHNGMRSIIGALGTEEFPRLRVGIDAGERDAGRDLAGFVLGEFTDPEEKIVSDVIRRSVDSLLLLCRGDLRRAMNQTNRDPVPEKEQENASGENTR